MIPVFLLPKVMFILFLFNSCDMEQESNDFPQLTSDLSFSIDTLATGLQNPWGMAFLPDSRILIAERPGRLRIWQNGVLQEEPVSGLPEIWAHGQGGLMEVVLHPEYEKNQWIYLGYSSPGPGGGNTAISRARLQGNRLVDVENLFQGKPNTSSGAHFGCRIVFDDENHLYFTIGDRGQKDNAQDLSNNNGKVNRINDDGTIPDDNPFVDEPGARPEIWTYGHRNIQGMIVHPETGEIWTHEHGPKGGDEINIEKKGENYGWPLATFGRNYSGTIISRDTTLPGMVDPVLHWTPSIAPCGLEIVTSDKYPQWQGDLLVGALAGQHIQRVQLDGKNVEGTEKIMEGFARFRDVRQGPDGFIYVLTESPGMFIKLVPQASK
ncbi:MAG: PQQ-dependent sugar dehydrogenase [Bacteroidota bacterium]